MTNTTQEMQPKPNFNPDIPFWTMSFNTLNLFINNCSRRDDTIKSSAADVKLDIEAKPGFPDKTDDFCLIIHDCVMDSVT